MNIRVPPHVAFPHIINCIAEELGVTYEEMAGNSRMPVIVAARRVVAGTMRHFTQASYPEIAHMMARRNHSTYLVAVRRFDNNGLRGYGTRDEWVERVGNFLCENVPVSSRAAWRPPRISRPYCSQITGAQAARFLADYEAGRIGQPRRRKEMAA